MASIRDIFEGYIPNFADEKEPSKRIKELKSIIKQRERCLVNIFAVAPVSNEEAQAHVETQNEFTEEGRYGGLGKTMLLQRCCDYAYAVKYDLKKDNQKPKQVFPIIEFAEQYNTRKDILVKIVNNLCLINGSLVSPYFTTFYGIFPPIPPHHPTLPLSYDPSYKAELLFKEATQQLLKEKKDEWFATPAFLFFDAFDTQYLGSNDAPLRIWLKNDLFSYLIKTLGITIFVAGREPVNPVVSLKDQIIEFRVSSFNENIVLDYLEVYTKRIKNQSRKINKKSWETKVIEPLRNAPDKLTVLCKSTQGKPIFIDYFADLAYRQCVEKETTKSILDLIDEATLNDGTSNKQIDVKETIHNFKTYLIYRLNIYQLSASEEKYSSQIALAITLLSLARHGLTPLQFVKFKYQNKVQDKEQEEEYVNEVKYFFENIFTNEKIGTNESKLTYVKNRGTEETPIRLLHDELAELFIKYYFDKEDPEHQIRNKYIDFLLKIYEDEIKTLGEYHPNYPKLLLEYIEYSLTYRDKEKEKYAIDRLLLEFSLHLDKHPDLCGRILEKGYKYYRIKESEHQNGKEVETALHFVEDYNTLAKIRLREVVYCLTERAKGWSNRIEYILTEVKEYSKPLTDSLQKEGIQARCLVTEGEQDFWNVEWKKGAEAIKKAKDLFYQIGDSHGLVWAEHLLGFEAQRSGQFRRAALYHRSAIEGSLLHFEYLRLQIQRKGNKSVSDSDKYRLHLLLKTINRANSNWAINYRYRGKILEAIKILESNIEIADIVGSREVVRSRSNLAQLYAIRGIAKETGDAYNDSLNNLGNIPDPMLPRRLPITFATIVSKNIPLDDATLKRRWVLSKAIVSTKTLSNKGNLDSATYILQGQEFRNLKDIEDLRQNQLVQEGMTRIHQALPRQTAILDTEEPINQNFKVTTLLENLSEAELEQIFGNKNISREIGDLYYQYGKLALSGKITLEQKDYFEEARLAFENARFIADKATFRYLEMESYEILYRLTYLSPNHLSHREKYKKAFLDLNDVVVKGEKDYGIYHDLLAKYYLTEADILLEQELKTVFASEKTPPQYNDALQPILHKYAVALYHGHAHNQERYVLILDAFADRMRTIFKEAHQQKATRLTRNGISDFFKKQSIYGVDTNFGSYLESFLLAVCLEVEGKGNNRALKEEMKKAGEGVANLLKANKFLKAAQVNQSLIVALEVNQNDDLRVLLQYYQQFYCHLISIRQRKIEELVNDFEIKYMPKTTTLAQSKSISTQLSFEESIFYLMKGTSLYRTGELWSMERFLFKETDKAQIEFSYSNPKNLKKAEAYLIKAIEGFSTHLKNPSKSLSKELEQGYQKLLNEAFFRLGELYLIFENTQLFDSQIKSKQSEFLQPEKSVLYFEEKVDIDVFGNIENLIEESPAIFCLICTAFRSSYMSDIHREVDALQAFAKALYLRHTTWAGSLEEQRKRVEDMAFFYTTLRKQITSTEKTIDNIAKPKEKIIYPAVASRIYFGEGNFYFSLLFELTITEEERNKKERSEKENSPKFNVICSLKKEWEATKDWKGERTFFKAMLHKMMDCYLSALNCMTDPTKEYENYHFNNMLFEINRRILLINKRSLTRMLVEDLRTIWQNFDNLKTKTEVLDSLEFSLRTHEVALAAKKILKKTPPSV